MTMSLEKLVLFFSPAFWLDCVWITSVIAAPSCPHGHPSPSAGDVVHGKGRTVCNVIQVQRVHLVFTSPAFSVRDLLVWG